jgi:hypothetical protein
MEQVQSENFFDIRISQQGLLHLNASARITKLLFWFAIGCSLLVLLNILLLQFFYAKRNLINVRSLTSILDTIAYPVLGLGDVFILLWQFYIFKKFGTVCSKAINESDELLVNQSFKLLHRYTRVALLQICIVFIMYILSAYMAIILVSSSSS